MYVYVLLSLDHLCYQQKIFSYSQCSCSNLPFSEVPMHPLLSSFSSSWWCCLRPGAFCVARCKRGLYSSADIFFTDQSVIALFHLSMLSTLWWCIIECLGVKIDMSVLPRRLWSLECWRFAMTVWSVKAWKHPSGKRYAVGCWTTAS